MHTDLLPGNEAERLEALRRLELIGTAPEPSYDRLVRLATTLLDVPIALISLLDSDRSGIIYFGVVTMLEGPRPAGLAEHEQNPNIRVTGVLLCLDPLDGRPLGRAEIPVNTNADETFREMTVLDEGGVVFLQRTEEQAQLKKYDCR